MWDVSSVCLCPVFKFHVLKSLLGLLKFSLFSRVFAQIQILALKFLSSNFSRFSNFVTKFLLMKRVSAQIQFLALKFLSSNFSRFSNFMDQILAHGFGLNSFLAKSISVGIRYLFSGFPRDHILAFVVPGSEEYPLMEGILIGYRRGHPLVQQQAEISLGEPTAFNLNIIIKIFYDNLVIVRFVSCAVILNVV